MEDEAIIKVWHFIFNYLIFIEKIINFFILLGITLPFLQTLVSKRTALWHYALGLFSKLAEVLTSLKKLAIVFPFIELINIFKIFLIIFKVWRSKYGYIWHT